MEKEISNDHFLYRWFCKNEVDVNQNCISPLLLIDPNCELSVNWCKYCVKDCCEQCFPCKMQDECKAFTLKQAKPHIKQIYFKTYFPISDDILREFFCYAPKFGKYYLRNNLQQLINSNTSLSDSDKIKLCKLIESIKDFIVGFVNVGVLRNESIEVKHTPSANIYRMQ
jgi:hypothetical protein